MDNLEIQLTYTKVIEAWSKQRGVTTSRLLLDWGAGLGPICPSRQAFCKWANGESRPSHKLLKLAMVVYQPGDWRRDFVVELMQSLQASVTEPECASP
jgi:hypothetical protein